MRGVSGVTGAGPLWNRIMLHLYERNDEPPPFPAPPGFVRTAICATTGHAPQPGANDCPATVQEWVLPRDLAFVKRAAPRSDSRYDSWLALQTAGARGALRIVFPHDGDVFVRNESSGSLGQREQQLALRAIDGAGRVAWSVGGAPLPLDASGNAFWPLRFGTWRIAASDGAHHDAVTVRVVSPARIEHPGFTYTKESQ